MRFATLFIVMGGLLAAAGARANERPMTDQHVHAVPGAEAALPQARQRLQQDRAVVRKLETAVARQESDRQQASERLQRQDQAIAELRRQLQALHDPSAEGTH